VIQITVRRILGESLLRAAPGFRTLIAETRTWLLESTLVITTTVGAIAQLGERIVRNDEVLGSSPTSN
jgi:50S ribosomal subunit-associated GTPase HflX